MHNNFFFKSLLFLASISFFVSCDKDFSEVGNALVGENHFDLLTDPARTVEASSTPTGSIASNNLSVNSLGVLDNAAFGQTTANFATQVQLASENPTIGDHLGQTVESVTLYIPYFSRKTATGSDGKSTYTLDSIYGDKTSKIKLSIYENKHLLGKENTEGLPAPGSDDNYPQLYYTGQNSVFDKEKGQLLYDSNTDSSQNTAFVFSDKEYEIETPVSGSTTTTISYLAPGMRLDLNKDFFEKLLFDKSRAGYTLATNPEFEKYFKGLYFNVEKVDPTGVLSRINFKKGTIVVKYTEKTATDVETTVEKSITLNLTGNTVNLLNNAPSSAGPGSYSQKNPERLYLKGGEGSVATIDLFNPAVDIVKFNRITKKIEDGSNFIPDELDVIKEKGWLINEASLTFYIDQELMKGVAEPSKLFLYDAENKQIFTAGLIEKDAGGRGLKYKIRITDYVRGLVNNDNRNVTLGVCVAHSVANLNFKKIQKAPLYSDWILLDKYVQNSYFFPESSISSTSGTILFGSNASEESKKLKLEIIYTKPK